MMAQGKAEIEQQAAGWVEWIHGPVHDTETAARFDRWIEADPRHVDAFAHMSALWEAGALTRALATCMARNDNEGAEPPARSETQDQPESTDREQTPRAARPPRPGRLANLTFRPKTWARAVAGLAAALVLMLAYPALHDRFFEDVDYATRIGQSRLVALQDGTRIRLGGATRLHVRITPWSRQVTMARGLAFFDVAHERTRTFAVSAGETRVQVLGTAFDVELLDDDAQQVRVYRGRVRVGHAGNSWTLPAGSGLFVSGQLAKRLTGIEGQGPDWVQGWFDAQDTPLAQLLERINRTSPVPVRLAHPELGELRISGRLRLSSTQDAIDVICASQGLRHYRKGGAIVLAR